MTTPEDRFADDAGRDTAWGANAENRPDACEIFASVAPELALGSLTGSDRATALAHLENCEECAALLAELSAAADALLLAAPEADPPAGFEVRWLSRVRQDRQGQVSAPAAERRSSGGGSVVVLKPRRRFLAAAAAAALAIAGAGIGVGIAVAPHNGENAAIAATGAIRLATLRSQSEYGASGVVGQVAITSGNPSWVLMTYERPGWSGRVECVVTEGGRALEIGTFWLHDGAGSWALPFASSGASVTSAQVRTLSGSVLATATFST